MSAAQREPKEGRHEILASGGDVIKLLADRFPQLYIAPAEGAEELHRWAAGRGIAPKDAGLAHFQTSDEDELRVVETPAGPVEVVFLKRRADFETFLQIVGHRARPVPIARTVGAITYRGLADWTKVARAFREYQQAGGDDWSAVFRRLAQQTDAFRSEIIVISEGPYSNIPAEQTPYAETDWTQLSREIRLYHECAHVVCRRTMPDDILPVWDEVTADTTGLLCATGSYDATMAARFLGVSECGFVGGRLIEYLSEEQSADVDACAREVYQALLRVEELCAEAGSEQPFDLLLELKRTPLLAF